MYNPSDSLDVTKAFLDISSCKNHSIEIFSVFFMPSIAPFHTALKIFGYLSLLYVNPNATVYLARYFTHGQANIFETCVKPHAQK